MKIKKLSHCCLVIDLKNSSGLPCRILLDPGSYSIDQHDKISHADIVLITHEHADHFHLESLKALVKRAPDITVITNDAVGEILAKEGITHHVMKHSEILEIKGVHIEAHGKEHALMHSSIPLVSNIGFLIREASAGKNFFFPGDAFTDPLTQVDVLALPVSGPWMKISEAIDYALKLKPRVAFPVHDGVHFGSSYKLPEMILPKNGIEFIVLEEGNSYENQ